MVLYENQLDIFIQVFIKVGKNSMYIFRLTYNTDIIDMPYNTSVMESPLFFGDQLHGVCTLNQ